MIWAFRNARKKDTVVRHQILFPHSESFSLCQVQRISCKCQGVSLVLSQWLQSYRQSIDDRLKWSSCKLDWCLMTLKSFSFECNPAESAFQMRPYHISVYFAINTKLKVLHSHSVCKCFPSFFWIQRLLCKCETLKTMFSWKVKVCPPVLCWFSFLWTL